MFSALVVWYLYLGGTGAGICIVLAVLGLLTPRGAITQTFAMPAAFSAFTYDARERFHVRVVIPNAFRRLFGPGYALALACLLVGIMCLVADLGRVDRVVQLLFSPRLAYITVGAYALVLTAVLAASLGLIFGRVVHRCPYWLLQAQLIVSGIAALVVVLYTGLMLSSMPSVPLWNTWCTPALFMLSGLSCGIAAVLGLSCLLGARADFPHVTHRLFAYDGVTVALELAVFIALLIVVPKVWPPDTQTGLAAAASLEALLNGNAGLILILGYVVAGVVVPLVLDALLFIAAPRVDLPLTVPQLLLAALVLVGGFVMRWCLVMAGMPPTVW